MGPNRRLGRGLAEVLPLVDLILPNEQELKHVTRENDLDQALAALARTVPAVVVKVGARGAVALVDGVHYAEPGYPVTPVDTTGAGDNFNAGFLYGRLRGLPMQESLRIGCVCGALATGALGGVRSQITADELRALVPG